MTPASACDDGLSAFVGVRARLFGIAYRMVGAAAEAEDVVQDVWVRWQRADRRLVRDPEAFLVTTATRLAINVVHSARVRRETHVGGLPEPVDTHADPGLGAERGEALAAAIRLLLETLSPVERAAYILREAFDYSYRDIAALLRIEEANARQVVTRAREHLASGRRMPANETEQRRLLDAFVAAAHNGDAASLRGPLSRSTERRGCPPARPRVLLRKSRPIIERRAWKPANTDPTSATGRRRTDPLTHGFEPTSTDTSPARATCAHPSWSDTFPRPRCRFC